MLFHILQFIIYVIETPMTRIYDIQIFMRNKWLAIFGYNLSLKGTTLLT